MVLCKLTAKKCDLSTYGLSFPSGSNSANTGFTSYNMSFDRLIPNPVVVMALGGVGAVIEGGGGEEATDSWLPESDEEADQTFD